MTHLTGSAGLASGRSRPFPAHLSLETFRSTLSVGPVIRPSPASHATPFPRSLPVESESIHSRTLGLWRMAQLIPDGSFWFGFDVSVAAIRSIRTPAFGAGDRPGSCVTRSYAARTAAPPAQLVFGRGGGASTGKLDIVDGAQLIGGQIVAELSDWSQLRAWGVAADIANRQDRSRDPRPSPD